MISLLRWLFASRRQEIPARPLTDACSISHNGRYKAPWATDAEYDAILAKRGLTRETVDNYGERKVST